jgi:hypothetical protein
MLALVDLHSCNEVADKDIPSLSNFSNEPIPSINGSTIASPSNKCRFVKRPKLTYNNNIPIDYHITQLESGKSSHNHNKISMAIRSCKGLGSRPF